MKDSYTLAVLERAARLTRLETAVQNMPASNGNSLRTALAALLAALLSLVPAVSAAQMIL